MMYIQKVLQWKSAELPQTLGQDTESTVKVVTSGTFQDEMIARHWNFPGISTAYNVYLRVPSKHMDKLNHYIFHFTFCPIFPDTHFIPFPLLLM